jgi:hypothetical protein
MRSVLLWLVLSAPVVCGTAALAYISIVERSGREAFPDTRAMNSAEAAALGDAASMLWFIRRGEDPTRVHDVSPSIISASVRRATTLEAAMWSRRIELIRALDREGVIVGDQTRHHLACLALDLGLADVATYLRPAGAACVRGEAQARVLARTNGAGQEDGR